MSGSDPLNDEVTEWLDDSTPEEMLAQAEELMAFGKPAEMLHLLKTIQQRISEMEDPTRIRATLIEGWWCARMDHTSGAEARFDQAIRLAEEHLGNSHPTYIDGLLLRAGALVKNGRVAAKYQTQVLSDLRKAYQAIDQVGVADDYRLVEANYLFYCALRRGNDDKQALSALDQAIEACLRICGADDPQYAFLVLQKANYHALSNDSEIPHDLQENVETALRTFLNAFEDETDSSYRACLSDYARILKRLNKPEALEIEGQSKQLEDQYTAGYSLFDRQPDFEHKLADWRLKMGRNPRKKRRI